MKEANFYKNKKDYLQCGLCRHFCRIKNNKTGICRARKNEKDKLYSLVYGYPSVINIDPIEKKPLFHFKPGSLAFSIGALGCNFKCANCQNWQISQTDKIDRLITKLEYFEPEQIVEEAIGAGCESIAYTYNEPTVFAEYALDIMKLANENDIKNVWVTNGYMSDECLDAIIPYLDAVNVDLKSMEKDFYLNNCSALLEPILENIIKLKNEQIHLEITTLLISTLSDDIEMIEKIADFIANELGSDTPWHLSKFYPDISWKLKSLKNTGEDIIYEAYEIGKEAGLKYVYLGNMPGDHKENTYCPKCSELAIRRFNYQIERLDNKGRCAYCDRCLDIVD